MNIQRTMNTHNGLIENNILSEIEDAAIYVGMSDYIDVRNNQVFDNYASPRETLGRSSGDERCSSKPPSHPTGPTTTLLDSAWDRIN